MEELLKTYELSLERQENVIRKYEQRIERSKCNTELSALEKKLQTMKDERQDLQNSIVRLRKYLE